MDTWSVQRRALYRCLLLRDLKPFLMSPSSGPTAPLQRPTYTAAPETNNFLQWRAILCGRPTSRWRHVTLQLQFDFPDDYPSSAPSVRFVTPLFHPNVNAETGEICANVLGGHGWSPSTTLERMLLDLQLLLDQPNTASPLNSEAAALYEHDRDRYWARVDEVHTCNMAAGMVAPPRITSPTLAQAPATAVAAPLQLHASTVPLLLPPVSVCARRWGANVARGTFGKPYKLHADQQEQLLQAVQQRVARDCTTAALGTASNTLRLSPSDEMRVRSILMTIVAAPQYFAQLYAMLPRSRARKGAAATAAAATSPSSVSPVRRDHQTTFRRCIAIPWKHADLPCVLCDVQNAVQEQLELYEYIRDTGLHHPNRIGSDVSEAHTTIAGNGILSSFSLPVCVPVSMLRLAPLCFQSAAPDARDAIRASLCVGSDMEEAAFTSILCKQVKATPDWPMVHVPPQLLCGWTIVAQQEGNGQADAAMRIWCEEHRQILLGASCIAFHWGHGHYCSLVLRLDVWRRDPFSTAQSMDSAIHVAASSSDRDAAAASTVSSPPSTSSKKRKLRGDQNAVPDARSPLDDAAVPFLHLDTLASACRFVDDSTDDTHVASTSMLLRICRTFNALCGTHWPVDAAYWTACRVPTSGPPPQQDEWSCGYHLLRAWTLLFAAGVSDLTPQHLTETCASMATIPIARLVQETDEQYEEENEVSF
jgi:ubiquitin-conjugating enzyme E2 A